MARLIYSTIQVPTPAGRVPLQKLIYETGFAPFLAPRNASLAFALAFVLFWYGILYLLERRAVAFRV
jgi:predicted acyltransferase